jgi:polyisoprenoid-binding protein YceI
MNTDSSIAQTSRSIPGARWDLDPVSSTAEFRVPHFWRLITVKGHFTRLDGHLELTDDRVDQMELTIDATSVHTGIPSRDKHLRSGDFFDTERHPVVRFRSDSVAEIAEDRVRVQGHLDAAGERVGLTLEAAIRQTGDTMTVDARTTIDQRELGMTWSPLGMTRRPVTLTVHASLRRRP